MIKAFGRTLSVVGVMLGILNLIAAGEFFQPAESLMDQVILTIVGASAAGTGVLFWRAAGKS